MAAGPTSNSMPQKGNAEYRKIQELASGGMGSVELSRAVGGPHAGEVVAVKRLHPHLEREKHFADMFFDEAWITAGLHHPNVVEIFDWGTDSVGRYLALEFVPGDSLLALIRETKKNDRLIPLDLALYMIGKTAEGLHAAHELRNEQGQLRHLVHRDVTPSNVLIGLHGEVKLIDFGVAKARDKLSHTSTGTIKGKFGYMSPEQARGFPIDRRSDVFSLGVVLWETLGLKRLYRSESELEILRMIVEDPPTPISTVRDDVPPEVENLLAGALAKNRDDRLGSCGEFADFIWAIYHEHGFTAGERELAEFFRRTMPERCAAIEQLLSGAQDFIEPTIARPASGSFSGVGPHPVSGAIPLPRPSPPGLPNAARPAAAAPYAQEPFAASASVTDGSLPAASFPAPNTQVSKSRLPLVIGLVIIGAGSLAGGAWAVTHGSRATTAAPPVQAAAAQPTATQQPAIPAQAAPVAAPTNPTLVEAAPTNAPDQSGAHAGTNGHPQVRRNGNARNTTASTGGSLDIIPLAPSTLNNPPPANTANTGSAPSTQNTAAAAHDEPRTPPPVRNDPPPPRNDPPRQTASSGSSSTGSGSSSRSGSGSGSGSTTTTPAANPSGTTNSQPHGARDLFGRDWN